MIHHPKGSRPTSGNPDPAWFTGAVTMAPVLADAPAPSRLRALSVTFAPGARTAWHTHPAGQTLVVTDGEGRAQSRGGPVVVLRPGDTVTFAPGEEHWHGAAPGQAMTHLAMHEVIDGRSVDWLEPVTEADYARPPA
jgi:quercetin dioxygenase-like cupin family protein